MLDEDTGCLLMIITLVCGLLLGSMMHACAPSEANIVRRTICEDRGHVAVVQDRTFEADTVLCFEGKMVVLP